ncbi:MAG: tellurite resistance TerB family protein [Moorea sp. SIO2B7]|nr:tellurite resistance TerB family protein [Moorena sp. SIO2B7]
MGRLKKSIKTEEKIEGRVEAFAALVVAVVWIDGEISEAESDILVFTLSRMQIFKSYTHSRIVELINTMLHIIHEKGVDVLVNAAAKSLHPQLRETAFAVCTDLILADGIVTIEESELLEDLEELLNISDERASMLIEAMLIKNRG